MDYEQSYAFGLWVLGFFTKLILGLFDWGWGFNLTKSQIFTQKCVLEMFWRVNDFSMYKNVIIRIE